MRQANDVSKAVGTRGDTPAQQPTTALQVASLCRQLPPGERFLLVTQLVDDLPADQQFALMERFRAQLGR
jgi:hypothetical protein